MLRWAIRAVAANRYKNKAISESNRASSKSNDAKRQFDYAKREKDIEKKLAYISDIIKYILPQLILFFAGKKYGHLSCKISFDTSFSKQNKQGLK